MEIAVDQKMPEHNRDRVGLPTAYAYPECGSIVRLSARNPNTYLLL